MVSDSVLCIFAIITGLSMVFGMEVGLIFNGIRVQLSEDGKTYYTERYSNEHVYCVTENGVTRFAVYEPRMYLYISNNLVSLRSKI